jgi:hypothetical protein
MKWAVLVSRDKRPAILNERHSDWPLFFAAIPRAWTAWISDRPPVRLLGTERVEDHLDIPEPGKWVLAFPPYAAVTLRNGWHARIGLRYDYVDGYYQPSFTIKRLEHLSN